MNKTACVTRLLIAGLMGSTLAYPGTIIVSGDVNIGNPLAGDSGAAVTPGNKTFFSNILGSGTNIFIDAVAVGAIGGSAVASVADIQSYYTGLGDTVNSGSLSSLSGVNLFISVLPAAAYNGTQLAAISSFLAGGGTVLFLGDNSNLTANDAAINSDLTALGSSMQIVPNLLDVGSFFTATGSQIASNALTAGITSFEYAAVSGVTGGTALFSTTGATPFIEATTTSAAVPEPQSVLLVLSALVCAALARLRLRQPA